MSSVLLKIYHPHDIHGNPPELMKYPSFRTEESSVQSSTVTMGQTEMSLSCGSTSSLSLAGIVIAKVAGPQIDTNAILVVCRFPGSF